MKLRRVVVAFKRKKGPEPRRRRERLSTDVNAKNSAPDRRQAYSYSSSRINNTSVARSRDKKREQPEPLAPRRKLADQLADKKRSLPNFLLKGSTGLIFLGLMLLTGYLLSLSTSPAVKTLSGDDSAFMVRDVSEYSKASEALLKSSLWNRSKLTIDTRDIEDELKKQFPELAVVNVVVPFLGTRPMVYMQPSPPALLLASSNGTYVLNADGKAMVIKENLPPTVKIDDLPTVTDQSSLQVKPGQSVLTEADITFIRTILAQLDAKQVKVEALLLPGGARELDAKIAGKPYVVKFNLHEHKTAALQAGTYLATKKQLESKGITPAQYIDVRLEGRAYYK